MSALGQMADDYLRLRRALGHKLDDAGRLLPRLVAYLETIGAQTVTIQAALAWAQQPDAQPGSTVWATRMTIARGLPAIWPASIPVPKCRPPVWSAAASTAGCPTSTRQPTSPLCEPRPVGPSHPRCGPPRSTP